MLPKPKRMAEEAISNAFCRHGDYLEVGPGGSDAGAAAHPTRFGFVEARHLEPPSPRFSVKTWCATIPGNGHRQGLVEITGRFAPLDQGIDQLRGQKNVRPSP